MIRKNGYKPIQSASDAVGEPCRTDETVTCQLIRHEIDRIIEERSAGQPFGHNPDESAFVIMRVDNIYPFAADDTAKETQELKITKKLIYRRTDFGIAFRSERPRPVDFGATDPDILLANRICNDVNIVTHVHQRIRHLPNARGGAMVGWERTSRDHRD